MNGIESAKENDPGGFQNVEAINTEFGVENDDPTINYWEPQKKKYLKM